MKNTHSFLATLLTVSQTFVVMLQTVSHSFHTVFLCNMRCTSNGERVLDSLDHHTDDTHHCGAYMSK